MPSHSALKPVFLGLAVVGAVIPWFFFGRYFGGGGTTMGFLDALFANDPAAGAASDVVISSVVFWVLLFSEGPRLGLKHRWLYVVVNLAIGLSCALPLYLWRRSIRLDELQGQGAGATVA